jgi:hypothetical protein
MIKLKSLIYESKILIPRRSGPEREKRWIQEIRRKIQDYIKKGCVGDLNLRETPVKILPDNLKKVGGNLDLYKSQIEDLNNLEHVGGMLDLRHTSIKKLPDSLKEVYKTIWLRHATIEDLNNLEYVGGGLELEYTPIKKLPDNLKKIGTHLNLCKSKIEDFNNLEYVGGYLDLRYTPLSKTTTEKEIRSKIEVKQEILL